MKIVKGKYERRWVIIGRHGLYTGQCITRAQAIAEHVHWLHGDDSPFGKLTMFANGRHLSEAQQAAWAACYRRGDRAVRALICWP